MIRIIPGDPALIIAGVDASAEDIQIIREKLGTDRSLPLQYLSWLYSILKFDFGNSMISGEPVTKLIFERFPLTLTLALMGIAIGILVAIPLGVMSAVKRWSLWDYFGLVFSQAGMAIPSFWLGMVLLLLFAVKIPIFPLFGSNPSPTIFCPPFPWALDGPRLFFAWPGPPWSKNFPRSTS